ncbi:YneF family protein [Vagococcus sp.]|uniref:YneF family protein n=1 Tax=Vagococcus sp. TaxID=1933889 RepID=UPI003F9843F1
MNTGLAILLIVIALLLGAVGGFFLAKKAFQDQLEKNPPVNEDMLRMMMAQMGQKPSEKKVRQMMQNMKAQNSKKKK